MTINNRIKKIEDNFAGLGPDLRKFIKREIKKKLPSQTPTMFGMHTGLVIDTIDPWKHNRVRFFNPLFTNPDQPIKSMKFASPISVLGGFDDSGCNWVPPAGSTIAIIFQNGDRNAPFYMGTLWHRDRGKDGEHNWNFNIDEYYKIHEGHRKGFLVGKNDGSQVFPPWNTENYNGFDLDSISDFENDSEAQAKITYPNIYGFKTPQKHMIKMVDGDYRCNHKWKRIEVLSSCGNYMIFKDDHIHAGGQWGHPDCGRDSLDATNCVSAGTDASKLEFPENCDGKSSSGSIIGGHPSTPEGTKYGLDSNLGSNPYFKNENECRPIKGPGTQQNNKLELPQSGIQLLSISGHSFIMDDSVEEPRGIPEWERSTESFDYGCNDTYYGRTAWISAHGHKILMNDHEEPSETQTRSSQNGIFITTSTGNSINLNDHTLPGGIAGNQRGISMRSTSNHTFEMKDEDNEQSQGREDGGTPLSRAKKAFIKLRTGYGLMISMNDENSQEETQTQNIQIFCPQKNSEGEGNTLRGPHILRFQEAQDGPGQVFLRVGGDYVCSTYDGHFSYIGDEIENPSDMITFVSKDTVHVSKEMYANYADIHSFISNQIIMLMAGKDCKNNGIENPCVWPVLCWTPKGITISDRVFASASPTAACASMFDLVPFHKCNPFSPGT